MEASEYSGHIGVVIPARNEAPEVVRATVENLNERRAPGTDLHIIVIDDGSEQPLSPAVRRVPNVELFRNPGPLGQGVCRTFGVEALRGWADCVISLDSHMAFPQPFHLERQALTAEDTGAIVGCLTGDMTTGQQKDLLYMTWDCQVKAGRVVVGTRQINNCDWAALEDGPIPELIEPDLLFGACYAFTHETYDRLGGFRESYGYYGMFERDIGVCARFRNVPQRVDTGLCAMHLYRDRRPYEMSDRWRWWGYIECFRMMFAPEVWQRVFLPEVQFRADLHRDVMMHYLIGAPRFDALQAAYEPTKQRTDAAVLRWMGLGDMSHE